MLGCWVDVYTTLESKIVSVATQSLEKEQFEFISISDPRDGDIIASSSHAAMCEDHDG